MRLFGSSACTLRANGGWVSPDNPGRKLGAGAGSHHWHSGDVTRNRTNHYRSCSRGEVVGRINELLSKPM